MTALALWSFATLIVTLAMIVGGIWWVQRLDDDDGETPPSP